MPSTFRTDPPRRATNPRWRRAAWPLILAATVFLASGQSQVAGPPGIPFLDKIVHFSVYGLLGTLVVRVLFDASRRGRSAFVAIALVSLYGVLDEFHQSFTPGRSVEVADWIADTLGTGLAAISYSFWPAYRRMLEMGWPRRGRGDEHAAAGAPAPTAARAAIPEGAAK